MVPYRCEYGWGDDLVGPGLGFSLHGRGELLAPGVAAQAEAAIHLQVLTGHEAVITGEEKRRRGNVI